MNAKADQKERSHETILASAARRIREKGIAGARVADVMRGAGMTVGGFYAHFASKEALVDETLRLAASEMRERLFTRLEDKAPGERAEVIVKRYLSAVHRDDYARGCPLPAVVGEVGTTAAEYGPALAVHVDALASTIEENLPGGELEATGGRLLSPRHLALGLVALMYGGLSLARAVRGTELSDEILKACRAVGAHAAHRAA